MNDTNDLATDVVDSQPATAGNADNPNLDGPVFDLSDDAFIASIKEELGEPVEEVVEEQPTEEQELVEDASDENIEAEESVEEEIEEDQEEVSEDAEIDVLGYEELFSQVKALEINGETYTPAQLKSILGQDKAAGTKAREAAAQLKEVTAKSEELAKKEHLLNERVKSSNNVNVLSELQVKAKDLNTRLEAARAEGDMYEVTQIKDELDILGRKYQATKSQVENTRKMQEEQQLHNAVKGLQERGLGYLVEDTPQATAWNAYASSKLTAKEVEMASMVPAFAEAIEKARKYDAARGTEGKKLVSKGPTLKGAGKKAPTASQKQKASVDRINAGKASQDEIQAYLMQQGRDLFKP